MNNISIPLSKPIIGKEEIAAVMRVLETGNLAQGKEVEEFERQLASYCGYKHAIATSNGTTALHLALLANGVTSDEVVVPDFTFIATANAPRFAGSLPVFVDVDAQSFNISPPSFKKMLSKSTRAVMPVSLYGRPYDVEAVMEIASDAGVPVISDNCQAIGAKYKGKRNFGDSCAVLSFYPTKNITTGEGGAILTDDEAIATECRLLRNHGMRNRYEYVKTGFNYRMTDIAAAIGIEQLKKLDGWTEKRVKNATMLSELLAGVGWLELPEITDGHVFHQYTIKVVNGKRDKLKEHLEANGIGCAVYYPAPLHSLNIFATERHDDCKNTVKLCKQVFSIPVNPLLSQADLQKVAEAIKSFQ